ncbi:DUF3800 domain-containing protein [Campylobacter sp. RM16191]|uniref:DUF3800 domain-containing protein n=1 Tax=Campylobacter sp. RM16191 TaxID=1705728 RepID=UPI0014745CE1|nr:DUF3800 domain-containing protein [Campylobacter sp. RM16191]
MKLFYLDDSGSSGLNLEDPLQPLFVLGGIVIDHTKWEEATGKIQELKKEYKIDDLEMHAMDIANSKGAFKGWDFDKKQEFLTKCLKLIPSLSMDIIFFKVRKSNYKKYFESKFSKAHQQMVKIPPYIVAYSFILQIAEKFLNDANDNGVLIIDEQDTHIIANDTLKTLRAIDEPEIKVNRLIEKSFFINSKDSNLLQLADIVAYYIKRYYEIELKDNLGDRSKEEREKMFKIIEKSIYKADFDYSKHKILEFINNSLDEGKL